MRRWKATFVVTLAISLLTSLAPVSAKHPTRLRANTNSINQPSERSQQEPKSLMGSEEPRAEAKIDFVAPVSVDDALAIAALQNLKVTQIQHSFMIGKEKFVGFYVVDADDSPATLATNLAANYRAFLQDIADPAEENVPDMSPSDPVAGEKLKQRRVQAEQALIRSYQDELRVVGITVIGAENQIDAVKDASPLVSKVTAGPSEQQRISAESLSKGSATPLAATNVDETTWVPVSGRTITAPSAAGGRYVEQQMQWSNVSGFGPNSTYEHDFFLKNSAGVQHPAGTYLDRSEIPGRIPKVEYYTSNLPTYYLDSRLLDGTLYGLLGTDEVAFTIGCPRASEIKVNTLYTSYIRTKNGDADVDDGKLQAQLGHRKPSSCYGTGCSYADQTVPLVPAWEVPVPGTKVWSRKVGTPVIDPGSLSALGPVTARITTPTSGATIRYTTNGADPDGSSPVYSGPLTFNSSVTLKARAFKSNLPDSDVATVSYSIVQQKVATPSINPGSLSSTGPITASISTATAGATIRYTTNGTDPSGSSTVYSGPLTFNSSVTLKAKAFKSGMTESGVAAVTYSISPPQKVAKPSINPAPGTYTGPVSVSISTVTAGAAIRYTTNGADPTSGSPVYSGPLTFNSSVTVKARAFKSGMSDSDVATATYSVQVPQPLSASCGISPNPVTLGQGATVSAGASGGAGAYRYRINGVDTGTIPSLAVLPSNAGTFSANVTVTDGRNTQASASCSAQVVPPNPYLTGFRYSPNPAKATKVVNLDIYGGGFASNAQVWFVGPGCGSPGCQTFAVNVASPAYIAAAAVLNNTGTYTVNIRNGTGAWVTVGTITVVK
jgi:hypothetical protein